MKLSVIVSEESLFLCREEKHLSIALILSCVMFFYCRKALLLLKKKRYQDRLLDKTEHQISNLEHMVLKYLILWTLRDVLMVYCILEVYLTLQKQNKTMWHFLVAPWFLP